MNNRFSEKLDGKSIDKKEVDTLQINLGKKCDLACKHCHVEAGPHRTEELKNDVVKNILLVLESFPQIKIVDLTGGAPEMNNGFKEIVEKAVEMRKKVIVRSNLTIFHEEGYKHLPEYFVNFGVEIVASLPCYLEDNVDAMRGKGTFKKVISSLQLLNDLGYGSDENLIINLVYNTKVVDKKEDFSLAPDQKTLEQDYKIFLLEKFDIVFNNLYTFTNIPSGRLKKYLYLKKIYTDYLDYLESSYNENTLENLMCKTQLSVDYLGNIFDCDFNQVEGVPSMDNAGNKITLDTIIEKGDLDIISKVKTKDYCFGCTAGSGCSCSGALV